MTLASRERYRNFIHQTREALEPHWKTIDQLVLTNQRRMLDAFKRSGVSDYHFGGTTGYGYDDLGRRVTEEVYATYFRAEAALVRPQLVSGTHAITASLYGLLRPGDELLSITGPPYDTLQQVIFGDRPGALKEFGVTYRDVPLTADGRPDIDGIRRALQANKPKVCLIQRSRGYVARPALLVEDIARLVKVVREHSPESIIFVDNCYGEFVEPYEPLETGVDIMAGSLIKNPGGGVAPGGGYIVGREDLVLHAAARMTAPGIGEKVGPTFGLTREILQGFFLGPHVVGEALRNAMLIARVFEELGFEVLPGSLEPRGDIIQSVRLGAQSTILAFCRGVQAGSPVDHHVRPEAGPVPGYVAPVVMAAGTFVQGGSLEFSADAPMRPPWDVYVQGGLTREHVQLALEDVLLEVNDNLEGIVDNVLAGVRASGNRERIHTT